MPSVVAGDLGRLDSTFHLDLMSNLDGLIRQMEEMVTAVEGWDGHVDGMDNSNAMWEKATCGFNGVLGGFQSFLTGLFVEQSRLERVADEHDQEHQVLEKERGELLERSHELHCRIQYNALETKLDQSFRSTERCCSVDSARCFRDEAEENLRMTNEMVRVGNLRKCQLDREIFNQMEHVTNQFQKYESERDDYVKEIELFDDVRRKKISSWLSESRSDEEVQLGEGIVEFLDLSSRRRYLEPKIIGNTLRMHSFNESLAFDRQDNLRRLEEMTYLQQKVDVMNGLNHILPRKTSASIDLSGQGNQFPSVVNDDDAYSDYLEGQGHQAPSGVILHRCPKKVNLATNPVTEPELLQQLESALRWENTDGLSFQTTILDPPTEGASTTISADFLHNGDLTSSTPKQLSSADSELGDDGDNDDDVIGLSQKGEDTEKVNEDTVKEILHVEKVKVIDHFKCNEADSVTSVCGDAIVSQASKCSQTEGEGGVVVPRGPIITRTPPPLPLPKSSHLLLHQIESGTGVKGHDTAQEELMACLVKRKSSGGHSSMTSILNDKPESTTMGPSVAGTNSGLNHVNTPRGGDRASLDDRDTRSQGQGSAGRSGLSGNINTGNSRTSRDHL